MHYDRMRTTGSYEARYLQIRVNATDTEKQCTRCMVMKPITDFNKLAQGFMGRTAYCKACIKETYTPEAASRKRVYRALRKYGPDAQPLLDRMDSGEGCENCGRLIRLAIDHCHTSGKVRGLLCSQCNTILGMAQDNPAVLQGLIAYLATHHGLLSVSLAEYEEMQAKTDT